MTDLALDQRLQKVQVWALIKKEYPDWYSAQITAANKLVADNKSDNDVAALLAQGIVNLRRQNAEKALAAVRTSCRRSRSLSLSI